MDRRQVLIALLVAAATQKGSAVTITSSAPDSVCLTIGPDTTFTIKYDRPAPYGSTSVTYTADQIWAAVEAIWSN